MVEDTTIVRVIPKPSEDGLVCSIQIVSAEDTGSWWDCRDSLLNPSELHTRRCLHQDLHTAGVASVHDHNAAAQ